MCKKNIQYIYIHIIIPKPCWLETKTTSSIFAKNLQKKQFLRITSSNSQASILLLASRTQMPPWEGFFLPVAISPGDIMMTMLHRGKM